MDSSGENPRVRVSHPPPLVLRRRDGEGSASGVCCCGREEGGRHRQSSGLCDEEGAGGHEQETKERARLKRSISGGDGTRRMATVHMFCRVCGGHEVCAVVAAGHVCGAPPPVRPVPAVRTTRSS
ncbi:hypothetical protein GCM10009610_04580 [Pseudonocardia xinjiangensis]